VGKYRKIPVVIEAMQFTGVPPDGTNADAIVDWIGPHQSRLKHTAGDDLVVLIATLEGTMTANVDDWIIKGVEGEFYPCKPDIFAKTYESADPEQEVSDGVAQAERTADSEAKASQPA